MTWWSWRYSFATQVYKAMNRLSQVKTCWTTTSLAYEYSRPSSYSVARTLRKMFRAMRDSCIRRLHHRELSVNDRELFPRDVCFFEFTAAVSQPWEQLLGHTGTQDITSQVKRTHKIPSLMYYSKVESVGSCWFQCHPYILACEMSSEFTREVDMRFLPARFSWL